MTPELAASTINDVFLLNQLETTPTSTIIDVLKTADELYFNDQDSFLTDEQYDVLKQYAEHAAPTDEYFIGVGSTVRGSKIKLPHPMGSLTQAYLGDIEKWIKKYSLEKQSIIVTDKLDGVSILIIYNNRGELQKAYSRGDGIEGADVTRHVTKIVKIPKQTNRALDIRAEVILTEENFRYLRDFAKITSRSGKPYKNARNMVAGIMNAETNDPTIYEYLDVVTYEIIVPEHFDKGEQLQLLSENQFTIAYCASFVGKHITDSMLTHYLKWRRDETEFAIDGLVIDVDNLTIRNTMNPTKDTLNPEYARKFKIADASNEAIATVIEVQWNLSKDGYFKPRVKIEPVDLVGVTIQHATGFNGKFINENEIGPGAKIRITRSGDVIPFITGVVEPAQAQMPSENWIWNNTLVDAVLPSGSIHTTVQFEQLLDFFNTIGVDNLGEGNLQRMFDLGFTTPENIIELTVQDMQSLVGSKPIGKKIFDALHKRLNGIHEYTLMGAHSCFGRGVGVRKMKKLWEAFEGDMIRCRNVVNIIAVHGFDQKTAEKIANGYDKYVDFYSKISKYIALAEYTAPKQGTLTGSTIVFTGFRDKTLEQQIIEQGGKVGTSVSKNTTILITAEPDSQSTKAKKAREVGVKVMGKEQFMEEYLKT